MSPYIIIAIMIAVDLISVPLFIRSILKKDIRKKGEDSKVAIRSIRRDAMEDAKLQKKNGEITEDDVKNYPNK